MLSVEYIDLGKIPYANALAIQQAHFDLLIENKINGHSNEGLNTFFLCEHFPVITLGKSAEQKNVLLSDALLKEKGIEIFHIARGGDTTFHGPGQLTGYPVLDLEFFGTDLKVYMRQLEEMIIRTLAHFGIDAFRIENITGVWVKAQSDNQAKKIAAFGVKTSRWITMHGFALNINTDLNYFNYINPCGITDKGVTSMQKELNIELDLEIVKDVLLKNFAAVFGVELRISGG